MTVLRHALRFEGFTVLSGQQEAKTAAIVLGGAAVVRFLIICVLFAQSTKKKDGTVACLESGRFIPEDNYKITQNVCGCFDGPKNGRFQPTQRVFCTDLTPNLSCFYYTPEAYIYSYWP
ncbi:hypothetical protein AXF42_Ash012180 [Apostasia shenzhenica]|uniref:Uncharacterized protein n=1 Tax=Apostasia shenzhenica TaxID=1088818 RepID=A0A2I0B475_9ASPA|nr:hypothetical protein AXF42_Ash012180 [Apostasia shenzhenica]